MTCLHKYSSHSSVAAPLAAFSALNVNGSVRVPAHKLLIWTLTQTLQDINVVVAVIVALFSGWKRTFSQVAGFLLTASGFSSRTYADPHNPSGVLAAEKHPHCMLLPPPPPCFML